MNNLCEVCGKELKSKKKISRVCVSCKKDYRLIHKDSLSSLRRERYKINRDNILSKRRARVKTIEQKEAEKERKRLYWMQNKDKIKEKRQLEKSKDRDREYHKYYQKTRRLKDVEYKLRKSLRTRLGNAIKCDYKVGSAVSDLGCSISELKIYLESLWQSGMSWDNWGKYGWHIDHIKPLSSFDLQDPEEFKKACHYTNLQPLWAKDNLSKSNSIPYSMI